MSDSNVFSRSSVYVIAEVGVNHDGSVDDAHALIEMANRAGADAVKFQTFSPESIVSPLAQAAPYQREHAGVESQAELLKRYVLPRTAWRELADHSRETGLDFMSSAFDPGSLDLVQESGARVLKLGAGELTNRPFLQEVATRGLPVIVSTGMATADEVTEAMGWLDRAPEVMLLHCVSSYPAPTEQCNLRAISTLRDQFHVAVGWSDHTVDSVSAIAAVALGAAALEKHITLDVARSGPDHAASADEPMFTEYVSVVRRTSSALGNGIKVPVPAELPNRDLVRRSWHVRRPVAAGQVLTAEDVVTLRPATGLHPRVEVIGRSVRHSLAPGEALTEKDLA